MCKKKLFCTTLLAVLFMALASVAQEKPVGWWLFDEGEGTVAKDISGNGYDGTIVGATWTEGQYGSALEFGGSAGVEVPPAVFDTISLQASMTFWSFGADTLPVQTIVFRAVDGGGQRQWSSHLPWSNGQVYLDSGGAGYNRVNAAAQESQYKGSWQHWAFVKNGETGELTIYNNGVVFASEASGNTLPITGVTGFTIGSNVGGATGYQGILDDVRLYDQALSAEQIQETMLPGVFGVAASPNPKNGATDVHRDGTLAWSPSEFAATHNVYIGGSFDDVNDGTALVAEGIAESAYDPGRLAFGTQYFWRVDEVNSPPDSTVFEGEVWSFTVEPIGYPVANITATASSTFGDSGPEKTIDGSGLADDLHSVTATDMWISGGVPATIEYTFDRVYKLHELWVWNSNQTIEPFIGFGAKDVVIEHSLDGATWTALEGVGPLAQATGADDYAANNRIDFAGAIAKHVRININSVQGFAPQASLSEVRFLYIPTFATRPSPASGTTGVSPDVTLSWGRDGREADTHDVHVGSDANSLDLAGNVTDSSFDTTSLDLQLGQTYSWRVDEVNNTMDPSTWTGDVWSFTTVEAITVDNMESYKDEEFLEIWATWVDGFEDPANNGALVGANPIGADFSPETGTVHGGSQSLPIHYDNSAAAQSEATRTFATSQDWTRHGVQSLVLYFHGSGINTGGTFYLKINDTKVAYDGDTASLMRGGWNKWVILLDDLAGVDLSNVRSLTLGVEGAGGGVVYVDDITLTPAGQRDLITPTEPGGGLVLHLPFDGDYQDASGSGLHGTPMGGINPPFEAGHMGQAVTFDGVDQYVEITGYLGIVADRTDPDNPVQRPFSVSCWVKAFGNGEIVTWGSGDGAPVGGQYSTFRIDVGTLRAEHGNGNLRGNTPVNDGEWHHAALTVIEGANLQNEQTTLYVDGSADSTFSGSNNIYNITAGASVNIGRSASRGDRYLPGSLDDVRIYDRALSAGEVAGLAGRMQPFDRP